MPDIAEPPTSHQTIGDRVKVMREEKGWSQEDLARAAELSTSVVARIEQGKADNLRLNTLRALAKALGVKVRDLIGEE